MCFQIFCWRCKLILTAKARPCQTLSGIKCSRLVMPLHRFGNQGCVLILISVFLNNRFTSDKPALFFIYLANDMTNPENFNQLFNKLKSCAPADVGKHIEAIFESYLVLERAEQKECAATFYKWADECPSLHPLLLCYAKFLVAFSFFYSEQYDKALPLLTEIQKIFAEQNDLDGAAASLTMQGSIFRTFGDVDLALKTSWA